MPSSLIARIAVGCALALLAPAAGIAQAPDDVAIGAIRWDAWFDGAPDQAVLEQSEWRRRAPFFARWDEGGKLRLDGDKEHVLHAEVAYAKAIGIDYFIFGYYPDTGSWGRDPDFSLKLNRALLSYLRLPDRSGVKFALSLNQLFPMTDVEEMAGAVATFAAHSDYMTTSQGALPLFILAHDGLDWSRFFGSDDNARTAVQTIRKAVRERTGKELIIVIMNYDSAKAMEAARRYGLDMVSSYTNFAPGKGAMENSFATCAKHGEMVWSRAAEAHAPYAPNVTLGWDNRPRRTPAVNTRGIAQGPWCAPPDEKTLTAYFKAASKFVAAEVGAPFRTITVYSWNEFTEGGWMAPNLGEGARWLETLRAAIGRNRSTPPVELTWPDSVTAKSCPLRTAGGERALVAAKCAAPPAETPDWPCPPGQTARSDRVRAPSGNESLIWKGGWRVRTCS